jgi:hypothetical protein
MIRTNNQQRFIKDLNEMTKQDLINEVLLMRREIANKDQIINMIALEY